MADKIPEGKAYDDMEESEKDEVMKNFIQEICGKLTE